MEEKHIAETWAKYSVVSFNKARELADKYGTPLLILDLESVKDNYRSLKKIRKGMDLFYAVKANPHPRILQALVELGSNFDVASKNEILMCLDAGAKPEQLLYANPIKSPESISFAYEHDVKAFTYDALPEVEKMAKYAPGSDVILRVAVQDIGSYCKFSTKFGARERSAVKLLDKAKSAGLNPIGLSFHVGSQCTHMENFGLAIELCGRIIKNAEEKKKIALTTLDMGGGIPVRYIHDVYSYEDLSELINDRIDIHLPEDMRIIMEPGRPMVGDAMTLLTRVVGRSRRSGRECLYLDDGVYNSLSEKVFGHCEYRLTSDKKGPLKRFRVFGPTCDSMDVITNDTYLPSTLEPDDLILVLNTGAYTNAAATHFNGFDPAKVIVLQDLE
jgi:ornithine decarboxylase